MNLPTEPTNGVPLSSAEIAGFMNWRGPGAYTVHAERRIRRLVAEAVQREREACAKTCDERDQAERAKAKSAREIKNIAAAHDYELNADQAMLMAQDIRARSAP